ncbi:MAG: hypothetical protein KIT80_18250 [Chitinophagaceae bacterium]|nr:hypothetical protein [Chitinophagaceae bacterium]MCW5928867.1 hypothetical protein [Chitinophagaceae bacterium]
MNFKRCRSDIGLIDPGKGKIYEPGKGIWPVLIDLNTVVRVKVCVLLRQQQWISLVVPH